MTAAPATPLATRAEPLKPKTDIVLIDAVDGGEPTLGIVKLDPDGKTLRNMKVTMWLTKKDKHTVEVPPNTGNWIVSAAGYAAINQILGISLGCPEPLKGDDGNDHNNPWIEYRKYGNRLYPIRGTIRMVGIGRNPIGNFVGITQTHIYDLEERLAQDAMGKWCPKSAAGVKEWGRQCNAEKMPELESHEAAISIGIGVTLIVDLRHIEVARLMALHSQRQKDFLATLHTMVRRNLLKAWTGIQTVGGPNGKVCLATWVQADNPREEIARMISEARDQIIGIDGKALDMTDLGTAEGDHDEFDAALVEVAGNPPQEDDEPEPASVAPAAPKAENPEKLKFAHARGQIRMITTRLGDAALEVIAGYDVDGLEEVAKLGNLATLKAIQADLEKLDTPAARKGKGKNQEQLPL